MGHLVGQ